MYTSMCLSPQVTAEQHTLAKYLLELTMVDYEMVHFPPSMVASAALALALKILDAGEWVSLTSGSPKSVTNLCKKCMPVSDLLD